jgi:hypothetical protein
MRDDETGGFKLVAFEPERLGDFTPRRRGDPLPPPRSQTRHRQPTT